MKLKGYVIQNHKTGEFIGMKGGDGGRRTKLVSRSPKIYTSVQKAAVALKALSHFNNLVIRQIEMEVLNVT